MNAAKLLVAAAVLLRIGGYGFGVLPSASISLAVLLLLLLYERVSEAFASHGRRAAIDVWRSWAQAHWFVLGLAAITLVALALRLFGITRDLGHVALGVDEHRLSTSVLHLFRTGEINYRTVEHYPGIHYWILSGSYLLAYVWGLMSDVGDTLARMPGVYFAAAGRLVSAVQSTATVVLTGLLGRRLAGAKVGILAAATFALAPLSVALGRQVRNDAAQTLLIVAAVYVALGVYRREHSNYEAVLGGALAGLAAGVKYTGVFVLIPVLLAAATTEDARRRVRALGLVVCGFLAAALLSNHFVWADLPNLVDQLSDQIDITGEGHWAAQDNPAAYHVRILAQRVVGWPMVLLAAATAAYRLAAGQWRWWLFLVYPLTYIWFVAHRPSQLPRWVYPAAPFAAVAACAGLVAVIEFVERRSATGERRSLLQRAVVPGMVVVALSPLLWAVAMNLNRQLSPPTYTLTEQWLEQNTAPGDRVLLQQRWLELDPQRYDLNRHAFLDRVLDGGRYELAANDWIVVHEQLLGHDALGNLQRVQTIAQDPSFFGNQGPDFTVFTPPRVRPLEVPLEVSLDDPAAAPYLGHQWPGRRAGEAGRLLPGDGAGLFLPPLGGRSLRLDIIVAAPSAGDAPPAIGVYSGRRDLEPRPLPATVEGTLTFSADLPLAVVGPRVVGLYIRAREGSGPVRLLGFRVY